MQRVGLRAQGWGFRVLRSMVAMCVDIELLPLLIAVLYISASSIATSKKSFKLRIWKLAEHFGD